MASANQKIAGLSRLERAGRVAVASAVETVKISAVFKLDLRSM